MESVVEDSSSDVEAMLFCSIDDNNDATSSSSEQVPDHVFSLSELFIESPVSSSEQVVDHVFSLSELFTESPVENVLNDKNRNKNKFKSSSSLGKRKGRRENNVGSCKKVKQSAAEEEIRGFLDFCENQNPSTFCSGVLDDVTTDLDDEQALLLTGILTLNSGLEEGGGFDEGFWSLEGNLGFERASHQMGILDNTSTEILDLEDGLSYEEMLEILCSDDDGDMSIEEFLQLLADIRRFEGHDEENEGAQLYGYLNHK
ncbi:hypothetical protein POTOM_030086 [Populus tomentosa]|uniref:EF-hand domain-containing protein n=1 Tax=Populus tomentosa TaxID=118781 RepID=A0A8X7ZEB5_POPTO|nr:hypothetical protein POTOM_030086 [Populus tomentosa]